MFLSQTKKLIIFSLLTTCLLSGIVSGTTQTEHWNTKKRAQSQRLTSSALNHLNERNKKPGRKSDALLDTAITLLNKAVETDDTDPVPHYLLGLCLSIKGRYEQALNTLRKANQLDPGEHEILLATGLTQYLSGDYKKAISVWQKHLDRTPDKAPTCALLGFAHMRLGDFDTAGSWFREAKKRSPNSQLANQGSAILLYLEGDLAEAKQAAEHAISLGDYPELLILLARLDYLDGDDKSAATRLKAWSRLKGKSKLPRSMTTLGFSKQHDFHFDPFQDEILDSPGAMFARAISDEKTEKRRASYLKQGKVDQFIASARQRCALNPKDFLALHETGLLKLSSGDYKGAAESFQDVVNICPSCHVDLIYLAEALAKTGAQDNARQCLEYYKRTFPSQHLANRYETILTTPGVNTTSGITAPGAGRPVPRLPGERGYGQPPGSRPAPPIPKDTPF